MSIDTVFASFPVLETDRFYLREIREEDSGDVFKFFSDADVMEYYDIEPMKSLDQASTLIKRFTERFSNTLGIRWGIARKEDDKLIGTCGFHNWNKRYNRIEIGYELSKEYWNQGVMSEVLPKLISFGFENLELNRIEALVMPGNKPSLKLLNKFGFSEEGLLHEYALFKGKYTDLVMLSLLKRNLQNTILI